MIPVDKFVAAFAEKGVDFFCGVPDSLLKNFCAYVTDLAKSSAPLTHVIAANEGGAVGLASGHYLATGKPALVYMQNSGQGNAVNPLVSLADPDVYSIPMILLVGWRGMPGVHDEPQHVKQGKVTISLFETLGMPTYVLPDEEPAWRDVVETAIRQAGNEKRPVALIVKKGLFGDYALQSKKPDIAVLRREEALENILRSLPDNAVVVSTTGMISREVYEIRERWRKDVQVENGGCHSRDFLTVGSMGHASQIALGIAMAQPERPVYCLDGDGASIMQMGNMAIVGQSGCGNLTHIVLNNSAHDSVGGQPTVGADIDLKAIARACGYDVWDDVSQRLKETENGSMTSCLRVKKPRFVEVRVAKGARKDLGRPKEAPQVNKQLFMETLGVRAR